MDTIHQSLRHFLTLAFSFLLVGGLILILPACSDDPILGPTDDSSDEGEGSYSSIHRLSPPSPATDSTAPAAASTLDITDANPERF